MMISHAGTFLEKGLIHRTARGELVRSKSEVIIADLLDGLGLPYAYEQPFTAPDGSVRYPDFTIDDAETGRRLLIEHLGIVGPSGLRSALEGEGRMVSESWRTAYSRRGVDGGTTIDNRIWRIRPGSDQGANQGGTGGISSASIALRSLKGGPPIARGEPGDLSPRKRRTRRLDSVTLPC
jgi:hypothetical protein